MKRRLEIVSFGNSVYVKLKRILYLKAGGSYTHIFVKEKDGTITRHLESRNLGMYMNLNKHGFIRVHRSYIINKRHVAGVGRYRTLYFTHPERFTIVVPKAKWRWVKEELSKQLVLPLG